jgi:hypothetical protein
MNEPGMQLPLFVTLRCGACWTGQHAKCQKVYCACECGIEAIPSAEADTTSNETDTPRSQP